MKRFSEQFKKQAQSIRMRASERTELRERLLAYMEYHPLSKELKQSSPQKTVGIVSEPFVALKLNSVYFRSFAGVFAVFLIIGVPFIAEQSVPGDILYPVKVQFNEELRSSLSLSPYAKVAWETERLERRISEARLLANEGKLTQEAEQEVAEAIKTHTDAAQRELAVLRESDSDEAAIAEITFASALAVQTEVLESHNAKEGEEGRTAVALAQAVAQARDTAEASQSGVRPSYDKLLGRIENESTNVYELLASVRGDASPEEIANVERRLADIERKIAQATSLKESSATALANADDVATTMTMKVAPEDSVEDTAASSTEDTALMMTSEDVPTPTSEISDDTEGESIEILRSALTDIQKLLNYMTHIDVRRSVSLEELVPVTLTPEEQSSEATFLLDEIIAIQERVSSKEVNGGLAEKVALGSQELEIKTTAAVDLIQSGNYEAALSILREAHILALDLEKMTEDEPQKEIPVIEETASSSIPTI